MQVFYSRERHFALALMAATVLTPAAMAQEADTYEEIIIIGEKRARSLFDTTTSVAVTTGEDIENRDIQSLQDILIQTPNVNQQNGGEGFTIRGVSNSSVTGAGNGPLATLYVDGAQISQLAVGVGQLDVWDIAQVEIFRGAQSLIQGRNSLAGSIHIRSHDPVHDFEVKGRAQYGEFETYNLSATLNVPLVEDEVAFRFGIDHKESDGFITNPTLNLDDYGGTKNTLFRGKLLFEPKVAPQFRALLTVSFSDNEAGDDVVDAAQPFEREVFSNLLGRENLDQFIATLELDYELNEAWRIATVTSFNDADYDRFDDDDQTAAGGENSRASRSEIETFSQELRFHYDSDWLHGHMGAYFLNEDQAGNALFVSGTSIPTVLPNELQPVAFLIAPFYEDPFITNSPAVENRKTTNFAGFFDFDTDVNDFITLHAGLRYDRENQDNDLLVSLDLVSPIPDVATVPAIPITADLTLQDIVGFINSLLIASENDQVLVSDTTYSAWLPKAGFTLNWNDDVSTSFIVQRGYRAGGADVATLTGVFTFDPEYTWTYEAALRAKILDGQGLFRANIFYTDWNNQQVELQANPADVITTNAGSSEYYGFEAQLDFEVIEGLNTYAALGYVKTKFKDFVSPRGDFTGNEFADAPNWSVNAGAVYRHELGIFAQANVNYQSSAYNEIFNTFENDARTIVNAKLGYEHEQFTLSVFARNLFDENYVTSNRREFATNNAIKIGDPRVIGGEITFNF